MIVGAELGVTEGVLIAVIGGAFSLAIQRVSSREARGATRDQTLEERDAKLWQTLKEDNARLRETVGQQALTIDRLERALVIAGIQIPD